MKSIVSIVAAGALATMTFATHAQEITGAGGTFPAPVYAKWAEAYKAASGRKLNYQAIGSGGGIKQILAKTVDFGASDDPLNGEELSKGGLVQFPAVIGGVVPVVNVPDVKPGQMKLNGKVLGDIFRNKIKNWNDPEIAAMNPGVKLPATAVTLVYRSDSSGTNAVFTGYLSEVSPEFKQAVGAGKTVNWPSGVGGKGNAGVAANVMKIAGAVGYVEYAYALQNKMTYIDLVNKAGKTVHPNDKSFAAAAAGADWSSRPGFGVSLNNQAAPGAWPITSATFILLHKVADKPDRTREVLKFFQWSFANGQKMAVDLDYVPLPPAVVKAVQASWSEIKDASGKAVF